uniref:Inositol-pentakisphosphate 2-kinase n=1 Tax=Syphacia muris TaxID=451379 RepID=A0A0N5B0S9_9BILA
MEHSNTVIINPRRFQSFCFRGEGRANFVISAKSKDSGLRIVWRLAKHRKSGTVTVNPKCQVVVAYLEKLIVPILERNYLVQPKIIRIDVQALHNIAKIPSLPLNMKVETYDELCDVTKFPSSLSSFPLTGLPKNITHICALEMPDATEIPKHLRLHCSGSTVTVEIKPKQGFFQKNCGINIPYCNNCVLQLEKCSSDAFDRMYDYCPLDLFSGDLERMLRAIRSLIIVPHRNLRIFLDGTVIHSDEIPLELEQLEQILFNDGSITVEQLTTALCCILAGSPSDEGFFFHDTSVLGSLLNAQRYDTIGIMRAYQIYTSLPVDKQKELLDKCLLPRKGLSFLEKADPVALVEKYLFAATMKDCSIMISLRLLDAFSSEDSYAFDNSQQIVRVSIPDSTTPMFSNTGRHQSANSCLPASFAYSIKIVDLDPKSPKNLLNGYDRFMRGVKLVEESKNLRRPCIC